MGARTPDHRSARQPPQGRLTATDWAEAALTAIGKSGLTGVAVEPIATRLGATKGSFYWHFPNRQALIEAALELWEQQHTEAIITEMETEPDPAERLRRLFTLVVGVSRQDQIEMALMATADHPLVAPVMRRATERRVDYVASLYEELGLTATDAHRQAVLSVSVYLGHVQLARAAPGLLPVDAKGWRAHLAHMVEALVPPDGS